MRGPQAHGKLIVAPGELLRSSAKCWMKITSAELGEQLQVLSGGPPTPISTKANCRWLELLPDTKTPFWVAGLRYDLCF